MSIQEIVNNIHPLPELSMDKLDALIDEVTFPKGHLLFSANKIEHDIFFIKSGLVRAYTATNEGAVTFWFGIEGDAVFSVKNYLLSERSYENIELLEPGELYQLDSRQLKALYDQDIFIANWGRKLIELEFLRSERRLISMQFRTAAERYEELMDTNAHLLNRVPLGYIASYLGIAQVSLSRIRGAKR